MEGAGQKLKDQPPPLPPRNRPKNIHDVKGINAHYSKVTLDAKGKACLMRVAILKDGREYKQSTGEGTSKDAAANKK